MSSSGIICQEEAIRNKHPSQEWQLADSCCNYPSINNKIERWVTCIQGLQPSLSQEESKTYHTLLKPSVRVHAQQTGQLSLGVGVEFLRKMFIMLENSTRMKPSVRGVNQKKELRQKGIRVIGSAWGMATVVEMFHNGLSTKVANSHMWP